MWAHSSKLSHVLTTFIVLIFGGVDFANTFQIAKVDSLNVFLKLIQL